MASPAPLPPAQYYASLPKQITGADVILHDGPERILLVRPSIIDHNITTFGQDGQIYPY
ncbi:MAG: hypothetical protein ACRDRP_09855 [Pseudonocardiaceae bacterium]